MLGQPLYKAVTQHAKRIQDIHLRLDVTGTYLQHDVRRTPAHMRTSLSWRWSMPNLQPGDLTVISLLKCEFSNRPKEARPEDFIPNSDRFYHKRDRKRGKEKNSSKFIVNNCDDLLGSKLRSLKSFESNLDDRVSRVRLFKLLKVHKTKQVVSPINHNL